MQQAEVGHAYATLRLRAELSRLKLFYLSRARKLKHAPKVFSKLDSFDLADPASGEKVDAFMSSYLELQRLLFFLSFSERQLNQFQIYMK